MSTVRHEISDLAYTAAANVAAAGCIESPCVLAISSSDTWRSWWQFHDGWNCLHNGM